MPINEQQAEQPAPAPSVPGLALPSGGDEPSRAGQSQPNRFPGNGSVSDRDNLPDGYLDASGGWTPGSPVSLMDLLVDGLVPEPTASALDAVNWPKDANSLSGEERAYKMIIASAITMMEQVESRGGKRSAGFTIDELKTTSYHGSLVLISDAGRKSGRPVAGSIPIVRRPNEARRFA